MGQLLGEWSEDSGFHERFFAGQLWEALGDDGWFVFQNWSMTFQSRGKSWDRQSDVMALHPNGCFLVFEVKGGSIEIQDGRFWGIKTGMPRREYRNPYGQARTLMFAVLNEATERGILGSTRNFYYEHIAVIDCKSVPKLPAGMTESRTIDQKICSTKHRIRSWVLNRLQGLRKEYAGRVDENLAKEEIGGLLYKYFLPSVPTMLSLVSIVEQMEDDKFLTQEQKLIISNAIRNPRSKVLGNAGTGKTFLAVYQSIRTKKRNPNANILILCYTKKLVRYIQSGLSRYSPSIDVYNIHRLASSVASADGRVDDDTLDYHIGIHAGNLPEEEKYDYIFIDEGQDFRPDWLRAIESLMKKDGRLVFFADSGQNLFKKGHLGSALSNYSEFMLTTNCRNTKEICRHVEGYRPEKERAYSPEHMPEGLEPVIEEYSNNVEQYSKIASVVCKLTTEMDLKTNQIVLLSIYDSHINPRACLYGKRQVSGFELLEWQGQRRADSKGIYYDTTKSFKGCEALAVIVCDIDNQAMNLPSFREDLYVACSRARVYLHIFHEKGTSVRP